MNAPASTSSGVRESIDGVPIASLVSRFGSPLFVYSERGLRKRYRQFYDSFASRYEPVEFAWSYKTNYLKAICSILHQEGATAEVVSRMEFEKALALGVPGEQIVLNGPCQPVDLLARAAAARATINADGFDEIDDLELVAAQMGQRLNIGLRINLDVGIGAGWSRFGFNLETGQARDAMRRMSSSQRLTVDGLHCHIGTFVSTPAAYAMAVEKLVAFRDAMRDEFGFRMRYLDIGGGFPSAGKLKATGSSAQPLAPDLDDYAAAICQTLHGSLCGGDRPKLVVESGRALVDEAGYLVSTVHAARQLADGGRAYVMDAGVNLLPMSLWCEYNVEADVERPSASIPAAVVGPLCMNIDVIAAEVDLPRLQRGDRLIFSPVGAYNHTQSTQFIEYRPNVVLISADGDVDLIQRAEELTDIEGRDMVPDRLRFTT